MHILVTALIAIAAVNEIVEENTVIVAYRIITLSRA